MSSFRKTWSGMMMIAMAMAAALAVPQVGGTDFTGGHASRVTSASAQTDKLNPAALVYKLPSQIHWTDDPIGAKTAVLAGDPSKPGLYLMLVKWTPHHMSHPHWHPNDRLITVLSGTWWVGTGTKFDPDATVPMPTGTFVKHFAQQVHYDGAKDEEAVLEIVGEGPDTATPAKAQ
ncbi:MAG TPA: cupin domain-containing protein [Candidatus Acidoferrales bacterium]|nr:cupin domain-containing protein [Candidatus Acidoferrales bacterium]